MSRRFFDFFTNTMPIHISFHVRSVTEIYIKCQRLLAETIPVP
uniref:Uncharacterized protein n=1 Tax=Anguilla anguilla TaxID=7936 RepID=A0A0E9QY83_ANGAN